MATNNAHLKSGRQIENVEGTANKTPNNSSTWKQHHEKHSEGEWPSTCVSQGCNERATDGAHVKVQGKDGDYIAPLCHPCNLEKKGAFPVDASEVVKAKVNK